MNTDYRQHISDALHDSSKAIADEWLQRLDHIVLEDLRDIFPTEEYLDHIPVLIEQIGKLLVEPGENVNLLNSEISRKALELGSLRHQQKATVSQLLREYDILANMLETYIHESTEQFKGNVTIHDAMLLVGSMNKIVRYILQCTVDAFTEKYMVTIQEKTDKLVSFNNFLSHELRTPLNSALLHTELLLDARDITDPDTEDLIRIKTAIKSASSLIENIEELVQASDSTHLDTPAIQKVDLDGLISDIELQLSDSMRSREVTLRRPDKLGWLRVETGKLRLILMNLISNSIKYSRENSSQRIIEVTREDRPDNCTALSIWDNGLGIPANMVDEVQSLRVRAHSDLDDENNISGQGIGLYLVSEAVKDLDGSVELEAEEGAFTRVTIVLPT